MPVHPLQCSERFLCSTLHCRKSSIVRAGTFVVYHGGNRLLEPKHIHKPMAGPSRRKRIRNGRACKLCCDCAAELFNTPRIILQHGQILRLQQLLVISHTQCTRICSTLSLSLSLVCERYGRFFVHLFPSIFVSRPIE